MLVKLRFSFHILMIVLLLVTETIFLPVSRFLLFVWVLKGFELQEGRVSVRTHTHTHSAWDYNKEHPLLVTKKSQQERKNLIVTFCQGKQIRQYVPSEIYEHIWSKIWVATISLLASQTAFCHKASCLFANFKLLPSCDSDQFFSWSSWSSFNNFTLTLNMAHRAGSIFFF